MSRPAIVGGCVVVYIRHGRDLSITALDPKTGEALWEGSATPSGVSPGVALEVTSVVDSAGREYVACQTPSGSQTPYARVVVANPGNGLVSSTDAQVGNFLTLPARCTNGLDVCVDGSINPALGSTLTSYRMPLPGDHLEVIPSGFGGRTVAEAGLVDSGARDPEELARVDGRSVLWTRPIDELFGPGATTDLGWVFSHHPRHHLYVGSVGNERQREGGELFFGRAATAAFDDETGAPLWIDRHSYFGCADFLLLPQRPAAETSPAYAVRCRYSGHTDASTRDFSGVRVSIEGFDVESGSTRWSFELRPTQQLGLGSSGLPRTGDASVLVHGRNGRVVLDIDTGRTRTTAANDLFLCGGPQQTFRGSVPFETGSHTVYKRRLDGVFDLCDREGNPSKGVPDAGVLAAEGAHRGGTWVVSFPHAVVGYRAKAA